MIETSAPARKPCTGRLRGLGTGLALAAALAVLPSAAKAETLEDALVAAYSTNPDLQAARAKLRATDEEVPQARAGWLPTITVTGSFGYQSSHSKSPLSVFGGGSERTLHPLQGAVTAVQPLFTSGKTYYSIRQAKADVRAGEADLRGSEAAVLLNAVSAYMNVIRDQSTLELNKNNVDVLKRQLEATRDRFRVGELTRTDVAQAEARLAAAVSSQTQAEAQLTASRANYESVVGQAPGSLAKPAMIPVLPTEELDALEVGLREHPALVAARERETASRFAVAVAKAALGPTINLQGQLQHSEQNSLANDQTDGNSLTAQLRIPLYQGGAEWSAIRQAKQVNSQSLAGIATAERQVVEAVANAWEGLRSAKSQLDSSREQVRSNQVAFEGVQQEAKVGSRTTLDVLNAEQELLNSQVSLVGSERNLYVAAYQLISAMGRLSAGQISLPVEVYDPTAYYRKVNFKLIGWDTKTSK
jgi:outer membrane protein